MSVIFDVQSGEDRDAGFDASLEAWLIGDVVLGATRKGAQRYDRSRAKIGRDGRDQYVLQFCLSGNWHGCVGDVQSRSRPGDIFIVDAAQPLAIETTPSEFLNLAIPRRLLAPLLDDADHHSMRVLSGSDPMAALLHDHVGSLFRNVSRMTPAKAEALLPATLQIAACAINGQVSPENMPAVGQGLFASIRRHIENRLCDPRLGVEEVTRAFGVSRSTLYRLFEPDGGFVTYVRERRLRRCRDLLADPAHRSRPIAEIAAEHGFANRTNFTRAFRRLIGLSPREVRMLALSGHSARGKHAAAEGWRNWMAQMH